MKKAFIAILCILMLTASSCGQPANNSSTSSKGETTVTNQTSDLTGIATESTDSTSLTDDSATSKISSGTSLTGTRSQGNTSGSATTTTKATTTSKTVLSKRGDVRISGRVYEAANGPWLCWSGTSVSANIKATKIQVKLRVIPAQQGTEADIGYDYVTIIIDGGTPVTLKLHNTSKDVTPVYTIASNLADKVHKVEIVKRTECFLGPIQFESFVLPDGGSFASPPAAPSRRIEFIGTSSLCGYGNEGTGGFKASEENAYMAFGSITARSLNAEQHTIAVSGGGVVRDYGGSQTKVILDFYKKTVTQFQDAWDFSKWTPQVVVVNLGDNDFAADATLNDGVEFKKKMKELISFIRTKYPSAHIFCTSGLTGASPVPKMAPFTEQVVNELKDSKVYYVSLHDQKNAADGMGANGHPSIKTHQRIADYLTQQIKTKTGW